MGPPREVGTCRFSTLSPREVRFGSPSPLPAADPVGKLRLVHSWLQLSHIGPIASSLGNFTACSSGGGRPWGLGRKDLLPTATSRPSLPVSLSYCSRRPCLSHMVCDCHLLGSSCPSGKKS
jgi:hypothetical protein